MQRYTMGLRVQSASIDVNGHVNNVEFLRWIQEIAVAHSAHVGMAREQYDALRSTFVVRRHEIDYLRAAREGEQLTLTTWVESFRRIECERITEIADAGGALVVRATTRWIFVSTDTGRPTRIPPDVRARFGDSSANV